MNFNARDLYKLWWKGHEETFPSDRVTTPWEDVDAATQDLWVKYAQNLRDEFRAGSSLSERTSR